MASAAARIRRSRFLERNIVIVEQAAAPTDRSTRQGRVHHHTMEGLSVSIADLMVYIHPSMANKVRHAILRQLSSLLFTYDELFDGVLLAYGVTVEEERAKILPGLIPYFGVQVEAKLLIFSPTPDMLLEGKVVKLGKESIHVIVLGFASTAIMLQDIRTEFRYKIKDGVGMLASSSHKRHLIKVGSMIRFLVKSFDQEMLHISGSLIPPHTGCIRWLAKHSAEYASQIDRSFKRHREREMKVEIDDQDPAFRTKKMSPAHVRPYKSRKRTAESD